MDLIQKVKGSLPGNWHKGSYTDLDSGNRCVIGWLYYHDAQNHQSNVHSSCNVETFRMVLADIAEEQFPDRVTDLLDHIIEVNDHPDTTEDDIMMILEKAEVRMEEL